MNLIIHKKDSDKEIREILRKASKKKKKINLDQYFGKVQFNKDGMAYQKAVRDEWK